MHGARGMKAATKKGEKEIIFLVYKIERIKKFWCKLLVKEFIYSKHNLRFNDCALNKIDSLYKTIITIVFEVAMF